MSLHLPHHQRFSDRKLPSQNSQNHHEKLYGALWEDILELRKKAGIMVSFLGIILPLLITVYLDHKDTLGLNSDLFTIFFGTYLLVFIQYFGSFLCLYTVPKHGIRWNKIDLNANPISNPVASSKQQISNDNSWLKLLMEQKSTYGFYRYFTFTLDIVIISTVSILALHFLTDIIVGDIFPTAILLLVFSFALVTCIVCTIFLMGFVVIPGKVLRKLKTCVYLILALSMAIILWLILFLRYFI